MTDNVITSQPISTKRASIVLDQPPSYDDVISTQPFPDSGHPRERAVNEEHIIVTNSQNVEQMNSVMIEAEPEATSENAENSQDNKKDRRRRQADDCCFVCLLYDESDYFCICRCFSNFCLCLADCTESCCENCADCLHNCCESNAQEQQNDSEAGCGSCDCCGEGGSNDNDCDCDCSCFD